MVERLIELSAKHKWVVFGVVLVLAVWAADSVRKTPLDALPDISDPQVIVFTEWMGRSPDLVEDQITYPLVRTLQSTPGVVTVRGYSMFGMSFTYALFGEGTDIYWARTRVLEQLGRVQQSLPPGVTPTLGPDASGVGWVYQYALKDSTGRLDLAELRTLQDFTIRPALQAVVGVAEVASLGGFQRQYQIVIDPDRLVGFGVTLGDITRSVRDANAEVGARVLELAGREYVLRGRGYVKELEDLESSVVAVGRGGVPVRLRDVARVQYGPDSRRGAADLNGTGETVGGIVVMRIGSNALDVIRALEAQIASLRLPDGVRLIPTYDRSELIIGSVNTLTNTLMQQAVIVTIICLVFLFHARSALIVMIVLPMSVLMSFIAIQHHVARWHRHRRRRTCRRGHRAHRERPRASGRRTGGQRPHARHRGCLQGGGPPDLLLAPPHYDQLPADLHPGRPGGAALHAAGVHQDVRDVRGSGPVDHLGAAADGAAAQGSVPDRGDQPGQPPPERGLSARGDIRRPSARDGRASGDRPDGRHRASLPAAGLRVHASARGGLAAGDAGRSSRRTESSCASPKSSRCTGRPAVQRPRPTPRSST